MSDTTLLQELTRFLDSLAASRICRPYGADPREALGELFLRLSRQAQRQPIRKPAVWVRVNATGLLRNFLRDEHRHLLQSRKSSMPLFSLDSLQLDPPGEDQPAAEAKERRDLVEQELARLPRRERDAVRACTGMSDETCQSLARRYGKSPQTISNWAATARRKLRPKLEAFR